MRIVFLYQLYDLEAEATAGPIFTEHSDKPAIRKFFAVFTQPNTLAHDYPEHFVLRKVGAQDQETGMIDGLKHPITLATGTAWLANNTTNVENS